MSQPRDTDPAPPPHTLSAAPPSRQWVFWLVLGTLAVGLLYLLRGVLLPFVAGAAVAYFLDPVADWLERRGLSRVLATIAITTLFVLGFVAVVLLLVPALQREVTDFIGRLPDYAVALENRLRPVIAHLQELLPREEVEKMREGAGSVVAGVSSWVIQVLKGVLSSSLALINIVSLLLIAPVVSFYLLRDWDKMVAKVDAWLPRAYAETIRGRMREIDTTLAGFVRGQATVCLALGSFYAIGLSLIGLDLGLMVGLGAGLISFIPYVGSVAGFVVSMGLAFAQFQDTTPIVLTAGVFLAGQFLEGNFLSPWLVGERVGLHPVWVIFALLAGGALFGFVGILLAVPVAAVIGVVVRHLLSEYLKSELYHTRAALTDVRPPREASTVGPGGPSDGDRHP